MDFFKHAYQISIAAFLLLCSCSREQEKIPVIKDSLAFKNEVIPDTPKSVPLAVSLPPYHDSSLVRLSDLSAEFRFDMKYATEDNFLKEKVYECDDCYLRYVTALALIKANELLLKKGLRLKLFDCYRPLSVQKKMWAIMPDKNYVANPYTSGSQHNRGVAVDLTIVDSSNTELDMGTPFDHFGVESHYNYPKLSGEVKVNRALLKNTMEAAGFKGIVTEWWHFSMGYYPLSDQILCDKK
ncbi:MAG: M15 family metallopeptidase [Cytophagaceae bacterium]